MNRVQFADVYTDAMEACGKERSDWAQHHYA